MSEGESIQGRGHENHPPTRSTADKEATKAHQQETRKKPEAGQHLRDIERAQKAAEVSAQKTAGAVADSSRNIERESEITESVEVVETTLPIVKSPEPLATLPREEVITKLKEAKIDLVVPDDWDGLKEWGREEILAKSGVVNEVEPEIKEKEIEGRGYLYWQKDRITKQVYGFSKDLTRDEAKAVLASFGIKETLPISWNRQSLETKKYWLVERGVEPLVAVLKVEGGMVVDDSDLFRLSPKQTERILDFNPPENWSRLTYNERFPILLSQSIIPAISGAGPQKPEWDDVMLLNPDYTNTKPVGPGNPRQIPNPEATARQNLPTIIERKIQLINEVLVSTAPDSDWNELNLRQIDLVDYMIGGAFENYPLLKLQLDEIQKLRRTYYARGDRLEILKFDGVMNPGFMGALETKLSQLHLEFQDRFTGYPTDFRREYFGDLINLTADRLTSVEGGFYTEDAVTAELLGKAAQGPKELPENLKGMREWYVLAVKLPHLRRILEEHRDIANITDPDEFSAAIRRGMMRADSTGMSGAELSNYYQRISALVNKFPANNWKDMEKRNALQAEIQAALLEAELFILTQSDEANPEKMTPILARIQNESAEKGINSLQIGFRRFRMTDLNGNAILGDDKNPIYEDEVIKKPYDFNLKSDILNILNYELAEEQLLYREIENAQRERRPLNVALFTARRIQAPMSLSKDDIEKWREENTILGATNRVYEFGPPGARRKHAKGLTYIERQHMLMHKRIRKHLLEVRGMKPDQVRNMEIIIRAANLSAFRYKLSFGMSEYDGIEIYGPEGKGKPTYTIISPRVPLFGRHADNPFKFFRNELRGRPLETNRALEESKPFGYMVPSARVQVREASTMFLNPDDSPKIYDVVGLNARWSLSLAANATVYDAHKALTKIIMKKFNKTEMASSPIAMAELIDNGNVRFGYKAVTPADVANLIDYEEEVREMSRYHYWDVFNDRAGVIKEYEAMQDYLKMPSFENLIKLYTTAHFSGRPVRIWDNVEDAVEAQHKIEQKVKKWFNAKNKGTAYETYTLIKETVSRGILDPEKEEVLHRKLLGIGPLPGIGPVRTIRFLAEFIDGQIARRWVKSLPTSIIAGFWDLISGIFKYSVGEFAPSR